MNLQGIHLQKAPIKYNVFISCELPESKERQKVPNSDGSYQQDSRLASIWGVMI